MWSGTWDENDPGGGYAVIGVLDAGCLKGRASIWMTDWTAATVRHNMFGSIFVPTVEADQSIIIGGILGDEAAPVYAANTTLLAELCRCGVVGPGLCDPCAAADILFEESPRDPDFPRCQSNEDARGQVWIREHDGLHGQIVINGAVTGLVTDPSYPAVEPLWTGAVQLGVESGNCAGKEISPAQAQPWKSPYYGQPSSSLGGGAVGLVPYRLHGEDCEPPLGSALEDRTFLNSAFCHIPFHYAWCIYGEEGEDYGVAEIDLPFYGPIVAENPDTSNPSNKPYEIGRVVTANPTIPSTTASTRRTRFGRKSSAASSDTWSSTA